MKTAKISFEVENGFATGDWNTGNRNTGNSENNLS